MRSESLVVTFPGMTVGSVRGTESVSAMTLWAVRIAGLTSGTRDRDVVHRERGLTPSRREDGGGAMRYQRQ